MKFAPFQHPTLHTFLHTERARRPTDMKRAPVRTEAEFQQLMGEVDRQLQAESVPIPSRPTRAEMILAAKLGEPFVHPVPKREPVEGCYTGHDLTIRVTRWLRARYGDRLKMYFGPGRMVMVVWVIHGRSASRGSRARGS